MDKQLQWALDHCDRVTRQHSKSFYFSSGLLPFAKRRSARALYAFSRLSDNIVDEGSAVPVEDRLSRLDAWQEAMYLAPDLQEHPVLLAWAVVRQRYGIPIRYSEELLDGMRMDLKQTRYQTFSQLRRYCYRVASSVGLNSMYIIGFEDCPETFQTAEELGVALQLTNILRDVGEDFRRGRIYLPQEDMERFGYREQDVAQGVVDERYRALMDFEIQRAEELYERGWQGIARLHKDGRLAIGAASEVYHAILSKIVDWGYDNYRRRAYLSTWEKLRLMPRIWLRVRAVNRAATSRELERVL